MPILRERPLEPPDLVDDLPSLGRRPCRPSLLVGEAWAPLTRRKCGSSALRSPRGRRSSVGNLTRRVSRLSRITPLGPAVVVIWGIATWFSHLLSSVAEPNALLSAEYRLCPCSRVTVSDVASSFQSAPWWKPFAATARCRLRLRPVPRRFRRHLLACSPIVILTPRALQSSSARSMLGRCPLRTLRKAFAGRRASLAASSSVRFWRISSASIRCISRSLTDRFTFLFLGVNTRLPSSVVHDQVLDSCRSLGVSCTLAAGYRSRTWPPGRCRPRLVVPRTSALRSRLASGFPRLGLRWRRALARATVDASHARPHRAAAA